MHLTPEQRQPFDCLQVAYPVEVPWKAGLPAIALATSSDPIDAVRRAALRHAITIAP